MSATIDPSLIPFFKPRGIVLIGASADPAKLGFGVARNLLQSDYQGAIHFVNPRGGTLLERPLYLRIADVPEPADLAVLLIPAPSVPQALAECGQRGIRAAIIAAGGFRETGSAGASLEDECLRIARDFDMRLLGPNCIGVLDTHLPLDTTFLPPPGPTPGAVAFISHSGAICAVVVDWARGQGFGLSQLVSLGNQLDVRETDVLPTVAADPYTRVITMYLEGVSDGRRFLQVAEQVTRQIPVIALKVGRFSGGQQAVASHTGALAGTEAAFEAAFRRAGIIRATTSEELFDMEHFRSARVPEYRFPERAAAALATLTNRAAYLSREPAIPVDLPAGQPTVVHHVLSQLKSDGLVPTPALTRILAAYQIPSPPIKFARTAEEAVARAQTIGYPVALKLAAPALAHKSDVDGVILGLADGTAVYEAFARMINRIQQAQAGVDIEGVFVQQMIPAGQEVVVGVMRDPLAADFPQLAEIEINPLLVLPEGEGAWAVDARARLENSDR